MDSAALYRERAEECRRRAESATELETKAAWLRLAEDWLTLADKSEQSDWPPMRDRRREEGGSED
jgi:hypothetical protein